MEKMSFNIDRTTVTEGEIVQVDWNCAGAERAELTIDNGHRATAIPLEITGSKRFRLNRSRGKTSLTITAWVGGHSYSKTLKVKVKEIPLTHAETVGHDGRRQWLPDHWLRRRRSWWQAATARRRQSLAALPPDKRLATRLLMIIGAIMLVSIFFPRLMSFGLFILVIYLLWFMHKR